MSDAAPPPWVKRAPGLSAAHKFMLSVLWGYGPYAGREELWIVVDGDRQPRQPARCWEPAEVLAELTGQPLSTVRKQLRRLLADGWILRGKGSMRTLAWRAPAVFAYGALTTSGQGVTTSGHVHEGAAPDHQRSGGDHQRTPRVTTSGNQTLQEHSNLTSTNTDNPRPQENDDQPDTHNHPHPRLGAGPAARRPDRGDLARGRPAGHGGGEASGRGLDRDLDDGDGDGQDGQRRAEDRAPVADRDVLGGDDGLTQEPDHGEDIQPPREQGREATPPSARAAGEAEAARGDRELGRPMVDRDSAGHVEDAQAKRPLTGQGGLFGEGETPKRDPIAEVLAMFNEAKREASEWAGLRRPTGAQNTSGNRKAIRECLAKSSGIDAGIAACRQVLDVQVCQARSHGKVRDDTPAERKRLRSQSGWRYFAIGNIFRADSNFGRWIERWDEDGNHEIWTHKNDDQPRARPGIKDLGGGHGAVERWGNWEPS